MNELKFKTNFVYPDKAFITDNILYSDDYSLRANINVMPKNMNHPLPDLDIPTGSELIKCGYSRKEATIQRDILIKKAKKNKTKNAYIPFMPYEQFESSKKYEIIIQEREIIKTEENLTELKLKILKDFNIYIDEKYLRKLGE